MATTATTICNLALAEAPHASISDIGEESKAAVECARAYGPALGELLEACRWTFATRRAALAQASNPREGVWAFAYVRPSNLAVLHRITAPGAGWAPIDDFGRREASLPYEVDEGRIYADAPQAVAEYTRDDPAESVMPPLFVRALALDIASRIVVPLTGDASRKAQLLALHEHVRARAMAADLNRQPVVLDPVPEALRVRG
jgi:hypothetical protein